MTAPYKACGCGRTFTPAQWAELRELGPWDLPDENGIEVPYSMRNCPDCHSTHIVAPDWHPSMAGDEFSEAFAAQVVS